MLEEWLPLRGKGDHKDQFFFTSTGIENKA